MTGQLATVGRDLGKMFQAFSAMAFVSVPVALVWGEFYAIPALLVTGIVPLSIGRYLASRFADARRPNKLYSMTIAASGWFCIALFGSLPFTLIAWITALDPSFGLGTPTPTATIAAFKIRLTAFSSR